MTAGDLLDIDEMLDAVIATKVEAFARGEPVWPCLTCVLWNGDDLVVPILGATDQEIGGAAYALRSNVGRCRSVAMTCEQLIALRSGPPGAPHGWLRDAFDEGRFDVVGQAVSAMVVHHNGEVAYAEAKFAVDDRGLLVFVKQMAWSGVVAALAGRIPQALAQLVREEL